MINSKGTLICQALSMIMTTVTFISYLSLGIIAISYKKVCDNHLALVCAFMSVSVSVCIAMYIDLSNPWLSCTKWHWFDRLQPNYIYICDCSWPSVVCTKNDMDFLNCLMHVLYAMWNVADIQAWFHTWKPDYWGDAFFHWVIWVYVYQYSITVYGYGKTKPSMSHDKAHDIHVMCGIPHWLSPCNSLILLLMCTFAYM